MTDQKMLRLFREYYEQSDSPNKLGLSQGHVDVWQLETTFSGNQSLGDWGLRSCAAEGCQGEVVYWDREKGYRCSSHR